MEKLFLIQLVTSFVVGGASLALLSLIAERASSKMAGIILSLPLTIAIGLFFTGWIASPEAVADAIVIIPAIEAAVMTYTIAYLYLSKIKLPKLWSMIVCTLGGILAWMAVAVPVAIFELNSIWISIIIYIFFTGLAYYLITYKTHTKSNLEPLKYSTGEKVVRAIFGGLIIVVVTYLSKTAGAFWGVMFSAFPAVFSSTLVIVHKNYDSDYLFKVWKNSPIAMNMFLAYGITAMYAFPAFGIWGGTLVCYLVSLVVAVLISKVPVPN
jgi:uncharacterized membrane protein (GlpM family)